MSRSTTHPRFSLKRSLMPSIEGRDYDQFQRTHKREIAIGAAPASQAIATRELTVRPTHQMREHTVDEANRSIEFVMATENRVAVVDMWTWEVIDEILVMRGATIPERVSLLDSHDTWSIKSIRGSSRDMKIEDSLLVGRYHFGRKQDDLDAFNDAQDGHLNRTSVGYRVTDAVNIAAGESAMVDGIEQTASPNRRLRISRQWTLREASLVVFGADEAAMARAAMGQIQIPTSELQEFRDWKRTAGACGVRGENLAAEINKLIDAMASDEEPREDIIEAMADAAGITTDTVDQILDGTINCPPLERLEAFAGELGVTADTLVAAAEQDGCDYS